MQVHYIPHSTHALPWRCRGTSCTLYGLHSTQWIAQHLLLHWAHELVNEACLHDGPVPFKRHF